MGNLSNLYISQSYQSLIHLATDNTASANLIGLQDGYGNSIGIAVNTSGDLSLSGSLTASLQNGYVWVGNASGKTTTVPTSSFVGGSGSVDVSGLVTTASFNAYTQSNDQRVNALSSATASYAISASVAAVDAAQQAQINSLINATSSYADSASFAASQLAQDVRINGLSAQTSSLFTSASLALTTASVSGQTMTFTKGDGTTFNVTLPTGSGGGTIDTGSFATTGSNSFVGDENITGSLNVTYTGNTGNPLLEVNSTQIRLNGASANPLEINNFNGDVKITAGLGSPYKDLQIAAGMLQYSSSTYQSQNLLQTTKVYGSFTASLQEGYVWVGDSTNTSVLVATSSFGGGSTINTGSFLTTGSANGTQTVFGTLQFNVSESISQAGIVLFNTGSDASGSMEFGVTGPGNPFIRLKKRTWFQIGPRDEIYYPEFTSSFDNGIYVGPYFGSGKVGLQATSGSLGLFGGNPTANRILTNIQTTSGLANTAVNLVFANTGTTTTIVSGSNNIWTNPTNVTAGFNRYIGGSSNIYTNVLPQLTGSAAFSPVMSNNISNAGVLFRAPVSSSTYTISSNLLMNGTGTALNFGPSAANNFERAVSGLNITNNIIAGAITATAAKTPLSASSNMTSNMIGGTVTLNYDSSSINLNGATVQGTLTVNNSYFPSTINTNASIAINSGVFVGGSTIYASGSNATFTAPRTITNATMFGGANVISASFNGDNTNVHSTNLIGQSLTVYGTNSRVAGPTGADWGSVFAGRWNDLGGTKAYTAETVFAVGTGTGASTRKTGFLIDSGSNTFVEGTLNVSGSTRFTGSLFIQSGSALPASTGSSILTWNAATGQVSQASFSTIVSASVSSGEFWSTTTQSGSAGVSGSITFNNSGSFYNTSVVNGTQLQVANAGVYNIQFSAQVETSAGADTLWIWFKKNGNNISDSASKVVLANNTAQIMTVNILDQANSNDYYEIAYQNLNGHATVLAEAASGNIPAIPSVIATIFQIR